MTGNVSIPTEVERALLERMRRAPLSLDATSTLPSNAMRACLRNRWARRVNTVFVLTGAGKLALDGGAL